MSYLAKPNPLLKVNSSSPITCPVCSSTGHSLAKYPSLLSFHQQKRYTIVQDYKHCHNNLSCGHFTRECPSSYNCKKCGNRHHTLLHQESGGTKSSTAETQMSGTVPVAMDTFELESETPIKLPASLALSQDTLTNSL